MRYLVAVLAGCLALSGTGWAQTAAHGEDDDVVAVLLSRIDALEKRIADLEAQASSASRPAFDGSGIVAAIRALDVPPIFAPPRAQEPAAAAARSSLRRRPADILP